MSQLAYFKKPVCGEWKKNSLAGPTFLLWFLINWAPQLLFSLIVSFASLGLKPFCSSLMSYPQLVLSASFSSYTFGGIHLDKTSLSSTLTWANCFITFLSFSASYIVVIDTVKDILNSRWEHQLLIAIPPIMFLSSCSLIAMVLHLPCLKNPDTKASKGLDTVHPEQQRITRRITF